MEKSLQEMIKDVLQDYIDNGLIIKVRVSFDDNAGLALRTDLIEKSIEDGLAKISDAVYFAAGER